MTRQELALNSCLCGLSPSSEGVGGGGRLQLRSSLFWSGSCSAICLPDLVRWLYQPLIHKAEVIFPFSSKASLCSKSPTPVHCLKDMVWTPPPAFWAQPAGPSLHFWFPLTAPSHSLHSSPAEQLASAEVTPTGPPFSLPPTLLFKSPVQQGPGPVSPP